MKELDFASIAEKLVTVVVPYYNHKDYVEECIFSVLNQTHKNVELIVIDDGSPDDGYKLIERLADEHSFRFIRKANEGLSNTLNLGLSLASGEYFCAIASDDVWFETKLATQLVYLEKNKERACSASAVATGEIISPEIRKTRRMLTGYKTGFNDLVYRRTNVFAVNLIFKTSIIKELAGYDPNTKLEDLDLLMKYTSRFGPIYSLGEDLAYYRVHGGNISLDREMIFNERLHYLAASKLVKHKNKVLDANRFLISLSLSNYANGLKLIPQLFCNGALFQVIYTLYFNLVRKIRNKI